jgi:hypothetical protein
MSVCLHGQRYFVTISGSVPGLPASIAHRCIPADAPSPPRRLRPETLDPAAPGPRNRLRPTTPPSRTPPSYADPRPLWPPLHRRVDCLPPLELGKVLHKFLNCFRVNAPWLGYEAVGDSGAWSIGSTGGLGPKAKTNLFELNSCTATGHVQNMRAVMLCYVSKQMTEKM